MLAPRILKRVAEIAIATPKSKYHRTIQELQSPGNIRRVAPKVAHSSTPSLSWLRPRRHCWCPRVEPNVAHSSIRLLEPIDPSFFAEIAGTRRSIATRMASTFLYAVTAQNDSRRAVLAAATSHTCDRTMTCGKNTLLAGMGIEVSSTKKCVSCCIALNVMEWGMR